MRPFNYTIPFAFDDSVRSFTEDGHLKIEITNISKANICPYLGKEIPDYQSLGLDPEKVYKLYRHPDELKKAVPTFNQLPLLETHKPVSAEAFPKELVVGSTGTDAVFEDPYLRNSLVIWPSADIEGIESDAKKELSSGYRYRADMTPGTLNGKKYDGVMRDIVGNHVALVREGRAGKDVVVGDSAEVLKGADMTTKTGVTRTGTAAACMVKTFIEPRMAMDTSIELTPIFKGLTRKNLKSKKMVVLDELKKQLKGKLVKRFALDEVIKALDGMLDMLDGKDDSEELPEGVEDSLEEEIEGEHEAHDDDPMAQVQEHLRGIGVGEDDIEHCMGILKGGQDDFEPRLEDEEGAHDDPYPAEEERHLEETVPASNPGQGGGRDSRRRRAHDEPPAFKGRPRPGGGMDTREVIKFAKDAADKAVVAERMNQQQISEAKQFVQPWVGNLSPSMSFDSAEKVYGMALEMLQERGGLAGVELNKVHPSAYRAILSTQPTPGARARVVVGAGSRAHALDAAAGKGFFERNPNAGRIKIM